MVKKKGNPNYRPVRKRRKDGKMMTTYVLKRKAGRKTTSRGRGRPPKTGVIRTPSGRISRAKIGAKRGRPKGSFSATISKTIVQNGKQYRFLSKHKSKSAAIKAMPKLATKKKVGNFWVVYVRNR